MCVRRCVAVWLWVGGRLGGLLLVGGVGGWVGDGWVRVGRGPPGDHVNGLGLIGRSARAFSVRRIPPVLVVLVLVTRRRDMAYDL